MNYKKNDREHGGAGRRLSRGRRYGRIVSSLGFLSAIILLQGCIVASVTAIISVAVAGSCHTATVEVEETPQAVYCAMLRIVAANPDVKLEAKDDAKYEVEVSRGKNKAEARAELLDNGMTKLTVIASAGEKDQTHEDLALKVVEKVCDELGVPYKVVEKK
jgi:hypothetical protein